MAGKGCLDARRSMQDRHAKLDTLRLNGLQGSLYKVLYKNCLIPVLTPYTMRCPMLHALSLPVAL